MNTAFLRHAYVLAALAALAPAAGFAQIFDAVAVYDEQTTNSGNNLLNAVDAEAAGNNVTLATFKTEVAAAFAQDRGGVVNFDGTVFLPQIFPSFTGFYGASKINALTVTRTFPDPIFGAGWDFPGNNDVISGHNYLGITQPTPNFTMSFSSPLEYFALTALSRGAEREGVMSFRYDDNTTTVFPSETFAAVGDDTVFIHRAPAGRGIVAMSWDTPNYVRWDDFGFIVRTNIPEPSSLGLALLAAAATLRRRALRT